MQRAMLILTLLLYLAATPSLSGEVKNLLLQCCKALPPFSSQSHLDSQRVTLSIPHCVADRSIASGTGHASDAQHQRLCQ
eukprot:1824474-Rhodomonas_salina.1